MNGGLAGMIYLSYICTRNSAKGELSSVGSERLPYKQRVGGSNPSAPTKERESSNGDSLFLFVRFFGGGDGRRWAERRSYVKYNRQNEM